MTRTRKDRHSWPAMTERHAPDQLTAPSDAGVKLPLEAVICTEQLQQRAFRVPDYETENRALVTLAQVLADQPQRVLQALTDMALEMFKVDSAGISLLSEDQTSFFWPAISGGWQGLIGGGVPRNFSPCGTALDRQAAMLFTRFDKHYTVPTSTPVPEEALLLPFGMAGREIGTLWLITHGPDRHFDSEDLRQLQSLARFASAAHRAVESAEAVQAQSRQTALLLDEAIKSSAAITRLHQQFVDGEQRFCSVFKALEDCFCIIEKVDALPGEPLDFRYVEANPAFVAHSGISSVSGIIGQTIRQLFPDLTEDWYLSYDAVLNSGEPASFERQMPADGHWLELHVGRMRYRDFHCLVIIFQDITPRKQAQDALRKSEAFTRSIIQSSPDCIKVLDLQGNLLSMESGQDLLGIEDIKPFLNKSWLDFWNGDDRTAAEAAVQSAALGRAGSFVGFFRTLKGQDKWWDVVTLPILDTGEEPQRLLVVSRDVTSHMQAQALAQQRTAQFESLLDAAPYGICMVDADFLLRHVNPTALPVFANISPLIGRDFADVLRTIWPPAEADQMIERFRHTLDTGEPYVAPELIQERHDHGGEECYEWQINRIPLPDGRHGVVCYFRDISNRVNGARAALASGERYRHLLASINEGYCVIDMIFDANGKPADYRFAEINPAFEELTGMQNVIGRRVREYFPELEQHWFETYGKVALTGEPIRFINEARPMDRWFDVYSFRMGGPGSHRVAILFNNITRQKKAEIALRASESLYRDLFNSIDEGFCIIEMVFDADNQPLDYLFVEVNPRFEKQCGLRNVVGKRMRELLPEHEQFWFDMVGQVALTGEPVRSQVEGKALKGWFDVQAFRIGGPGSLRVALIFNNITERKNVEHVLAEHARTLVSLDHRKDEFLAMLSHELRNPLAAISNVAHLLRLQNYEDPKLNQARGIIERQVGQLNHLVHDLLEISRITSGRVELRLGQVDAQGIINRALETTHQLIHRRQHELTLSMPPEPLWLYADAARLEQVVANLVTNAAKYTETGGRITLSVQQESANVVLRLSDNGIGIPPDVLPRIFELFTQAERSLDRSDGGLGIGLCLVKQLVELHGGTVEAQSTVGKGSEFVVRLPMMAASTAPAIPLATSPAALPLLAAAADESAPLKLLVVDDNVDAARSLGDILTLTGHEVRLSHDGSAALQAAQDWQPDAVLLDIGLPLMNGLEVARRIRAQPELARMVLVAMTGYGQETDRNLSLQAGFDHHLVKPAEFADVENILRTVAQRPAGWLA